VADAAWQGSQHRPGQTAQDQAEHSNNGKAHTSRNSYIGGGWRLSSPTSLRRPSFLRPSPPFKDGRFLSSLRSISNCKPAACVSRARTMRRIRFDPISGRSDLVTGMEPLSTDATSSIFSDSGMNMRDLFAEDVRASFRPRRATSSSVKKTSAFSQRARSA
jgi:hypothetical protein